MPLSDDVSPAGVSSNIRELKASGYSNPKQRIAIALSHRREVMKKKRKAAASGGNVGR